MDFATAIFLPWMVYLLTKILEELRAIRKTAAGRAALAAKEEQP